jgi:hypothetical protein
MTKTRASLAVGLWLAVAAPLPYAIRPALADSLPSVTSGARPGPDVLYAPAASSPQLENVGVWSADPILVSGASAYRGGEFLYQDFLYDDHGAAEQSDPGDPRSAGNLFSRPSGTYTYPTDPAYANDAADLVELRVKPLATETAFRLTLNTLNDASLVAFSIAIGGNPLLPHAFPAGANVMAPADLFLTVHPGGTGMVGELVDALTESPIAGPAPVVTVDLVRRQIEVRVLHTAWDPTGQVVRLAAGVGLWDGANGRYLLPQAAADATHPGGAGMAANPAAFFNLAFRYAEPMPDPGDPAGTATGPAWWRDKSQGEQLALGVITTFHADVDFTKLAAAIDDDMPDQPGGVPQSGPIDRILVSQFELAQGADFSVACFPRSVDGGTSCTGQYLGRLQPYALYVPPGGAPPAGYGMTLLLHSLSTNYNQYLGTRHQSQFGDRGPGSIVITPEARGPDGFYDSYAGADVFEVWADVARRYALDPDWTVITGYSMGGFGTFKLAEQFPDLFAKGQPTVGASGDNNLVPSLRNIPFLMWNMSVDELVPPATYLPTAMALDDLGYRYELDVFSPGEHLTLAINDQYSPAAAFLGLTTVDRNPAHVTYVVDPTLDYPALDFVADHAYWLSALTLRSTTPPITGGHAEGTIDVRSHGFGVGDPTPSPTQFGAGTLTGGNLPAPLAYTRQYRTWGTAPAIPVENLADVGLTNIGAARIDLARASLDPAAILTLPTTSDGDAVLTLDGVFPPGRLVFEDGLILPGGSAGAGGAVVPVRSGTHTYVIAPALACGASPATGCRRPTAPRRALLRLRNVTPDIKDRLLWKWKHGAATSIADFGNPPASTGYALCMYDGAGLLLEGASAPADGSCNGRPCWRATRSGFRYVDPALTPSGLRQIVLRAGAAGKAQIVVKGRGPLLALPALPISTLPVTVQLVSSDGVCWEATYSSALRNQTGQFKASSD